MHIKKHEVRTADYIHVYHAAVGELLVCKSLPRNNVYACCGCIGYRDSCHAFAMRHLRVLNLEAVLCKITS